MKKFRKNQGITLIALVITVIVLLILAGITISALFGENGLLNRATDATEKYSKAEAKEKVELLLSEYVIDKATGENDNLANFLRKNLQVGVAENDDNTYSFLLGEWQVVATENEVISIEKFELDVDKTYPSVASMKADTELTEGQLVQTEGYWDEQYGGGAYYDIVSSTSLTVDNGKCIQLDNGLYAELHPINDTVTVNQFGAYGDGEHDDAEAIQKSLNAEFGNVMLESEEYKSNASIKLSTSNVSLIGNKGTLFTTNDFVATEEWFFIIQANDINMYSLNLEAQETISLGYKTQLGVIKASNIEIYNCSFTVPETAPSQTTDGGKKEYTNIDLYSGWHNVSIENCNLQVLHDGEAGGCIWIRDIWNLGCDNLKFTNNNCYKICHDEILAIFMGTIENIVIENNNFKVEEKLASSSVMNFTIGSEDTQKCDNVIMQNNQIETVSEGGLIWSTNATNVKIQNNNIIYKQSDNGDIVTYMFRGNMNIENNNINVNDSTNSNSVSIFVTNKNQILNNNVVSEKKLGSIFEQCDYIENNHIELKNNCSTLFNNIGGICKSNSIISSSKITNIFQWYLYAIDSDVTIENNVVEYNFDEINDNTTSTFAVINSATLNNKKIIFENNTVKGSKINKNGRLLFFIINDTEPQTLILRNNNIDTYISTYIPDNRHNVIIEN